MTAKLNTRKPTGAVPWPLVLLEGGEKTGKSYTCAKFTADERIGRAFWLDLGEGSADEYAAIPGTEYEVLVHDGTWQQILGQVQAVHAEATRAAAAGDKPVVLIIDSMSAEWDLLKDWVGDRARRSNAGRAALRRDPDAEVKPAMNLWNDANIRHYSLMRLLMQFPGIVVMTARGKETAKIGSDGRPIVGEHDYKVDGHKSLGFDASAWVRLSRDGAPLVIGARSVAHGLRPGVDKPQPSPSFTLSWLVFDLLKCDPSTAKVRDLAPIDAREAADDHPAPEPEPAAPSIDVDGLLEAISDAADKDALEGLYRRNIGKCGARTAEVKAATTARLEALRAQGAAAPNTGEQQHDQAVATVQAELGGQHLAAVA